MVSDEPPHVSGRSELSDEDRDRLDALPRLLGRQREDAEAACEEIRVVALAVADAAHIEIEITAGCGLGESPG